MRHLLRCVRAVAGGTPSDITANASISELMRGLGYATRGTLVLEPEVCVPEGGTPTLVINSKTVR